MDHNGDDVHISTDDARGGATPHVMRWVLIISVVLAVILLSASWMLPAITESESNESLTSGAMMPKSEADTGTDGVLLNDGTPEQDPLAEKKQDNDGLDVIEN